MLTDSLCLARFDLPGLSIQDGHEPCATVEIATNKFLAVLVGVGVQQRTVQEQLDLEVGHHELEVG